MKMLCLIVLFIGGTYTKVYGLFIPPCEEYTAEIFVTNGQVFQVRWYASEVLLTACRRSSTTELTEFNFENIRGASKVQFYGISLPPLIELTETTDVYMIGATPSGEWDCPKLSYMHIQDPNLTQMSPNWLGGCSQLHDVKLDENTAFDVGSIIDSTKELHKLEILDLKDIFANENVFLFPTKRGKDQSLKELIISFKKSKPSSSRSADLSGSLVWQLSQLFNLQTLSLQNFWAFDFCAQGNGSELHFHSLRRLELIETNTTRLCFNKLRVAPQMKELYIKHGTINEIKFSELLSTTAPIVQVTFEQVKVQVLVFTYQDFFALTDETKKGKVTLSGVDLSVDCDCSQSLWLTRAMHEDLLLAPGVTCSDRTSPANHSCEMMDCQRISCGSTITCVCCENGPGRVAADCRNTDLTKWPEDLLSLDNLTQLLIRNNFLTSLPKELPKNLWLLDLTNNDILRKWDKDSLAVLFENRNRTVRLAGNPIVCSCDHRPLLLVLQLHQNQVEDYESLACADDSKKISEVDLAVLCASRDRDTAILITVSLAFVVAVLALVIGTGIYYRRPIQIYLFARGWCLYFIREDELDADRCYDVFLSFCHADSELVINKILPILDQNYSVCVHIRNFIPGEMIPTQITNCIAKSKRTVVVLSRNFIKSLWGLLEFRTAHTNALLEGRARVVMIVMDDILEGEDLEGEVRSYVRLNTYVKWGDPWFWEKLKYALPHQPMRNAVKDMNSTSVEQYLNSSF